MREQRVIRVYGIVQGVGFRPTVARHAHTCGVDGFVCNKGPFVEIVVQGETERLEQFEELIKNQPPKRAVILKMDQKPLTEDAYQKKIEKYPFAFHVEQVYEKKDTSELKQAEMQESKDASEIKKAKVYELKATSELKQAEMQESKDASEIKKAKVYELKATSELKQAEMQESKDASEIKKAKVYELKATSELKQAEMQESKDVTESKQEVTNFHIVESEKLKGDIFVSPDIGICKDCETELYDETNPRYLHPFINCTCCGPRLTILESMPYDRERTSMKHFPMCEHCAEEYGTRENRRFDAQPVCCNDCGPHVYFKDHSHEDYRDGRAITAARKCLLEGGIIAVKGIGGFHLCCDATNEAAVSRLRQLKNRPVKPLAVMMRDVATVKQYCNLSKKCEKQLTGYQKPIILLQKKEIIRNTCNKNAECRIKSNTINQVASTGIEVATDEGTAHMLAPSVAPGNPKVGVMLPYVPLQLLLMDYPDGLESMHALVMTSGNVSGAPICRTDEDVANEIEGFCDGVLSHNREILLRADDSVMDWHDDAPYMIRRSRGFAPLPVMLKQESKKTVLAIGGELKNSFCIGKEDLLYLSPYIGDMADVRTIQALRQSVERMNSLLEASPSLVVCDMHPGYYTTAEAAQMGLPVVKVQHHYAHILSCMAENDVTSEEVLGIALDGTGYGLDGTIWGGEILKASLNGFERLASIEPFLQLGGDASSKEGYRIAVSMIHDLYEEQEARDIIEKLKLTDEATTKVLFAMAKHNLNAVVSTSAGRLFDAVSAVLGIRKASTFEGEAATFLQFEAEKYAKKLDGWSEKIFELYQEIGQPITTIELCQISEEPEHIQTKKKPELSQVPEGLIVEEIRNEQAYYKQKKMQAMIYMYDMLADADEETLKQELSSSEPTYREEHFLPTKRLFAYILQQRLAGESKELLSYLFHDLFAEALVQEAVKLCQQEGLQTVALSGGVYQNTLLLSLTKRGLEKVGLRVLTHHLVPPNDGGIALGQALYGLHYEED